MKKLVYLLCVCALCACEKTQDHQPANPSKWSPVGHKYVSTDTDIAYGHYGDVVEFVTRDTMYRERNGHNYYVVYEMEYPYILSGVEKVRWLMFKDTLTITKVSQLADESSCYELVY